MTNLVLDAVLADRNELKAELAVLRKAASISYGLLWLFQGNSEDNPMCHLAFAARMGLRDALSRDDLRTGIVAAAWEAEVGRDLSNAGYHVARAEFGACDVGAPYLRRRVFLVACASLPRLALAWAALPSAIERVKRAADARGDWNPDQLAALRVDARSAGEMDRGQSLQRRERIEALGDSNPPHMAEAIGRAIASAPHPPREPT